MDKQEYISKQAVIEALCKRCDEIMAWPVYSRELLLEADHINNCIKTVSALPAADVAPVVRCKDCRFWGVIQSKLCDIHHRAADESDYCSYGVRVARMKEEQASD